MEAGVGQTKNQNDESAIVIGCIAALCVLICMGLAASFYLLRPQGWPGQRLLVATSTLLPTSTPITHQPLAGDKVLKEDFSNNNNRWLAQDTQWRAEDNPPTDVHIRDGKLSVESLRPGSSGTAYCEACPVLARPFYIQADFSTNKSISEAYGLAFSSGPTHDDFYLFQIKEQTAHFSLYKYGGQKWTLRISRTSDLIKPYPNVNTLGVGLEQDRIVMYINGQQVDTYQDTGNALPSGAYWPYTENAGFTLIVDNFFAYGK